MTGASGVIGAAVARASAAEGCRVAVHHRDGRERAEDVAPRIVVLASDRLSGHVTGQVITVAGGKEGRVVHEV